MMKATGIVRKLDELGRLVLPKELRRTMGLTEGDALEIFTEGEAVMLRRYTPLCVFCGGGGDMVAHKGKQVCQNCRSLLGSSTAPH
ncbi:MAG: SpoVT/AbrB family regulatory protein [Symbiobacteriaceae bacterium]|jgi:transcriptional pleiotropic regulator of transition state genes|nr:SpoVT/AbrB family regulatory protein [Symbiobacteriaceae bacterium]